MDETMGKPAEQCLAITEKKRAHRPGGCVGIFFQLFDWNRRFAKKKLFSRKLLPPARAKQPSTKFGGDEKMPKTKLHLIAEENKRGFPNGKKNGNGRGDIVVQKHEMRAPGLVARLMGLDSLPAVQQDKHKKASKSVFCPVKEEKTLNDSHSGSDRDDSNTENGIKRVESRPQKLLKTGQLERQAVTRFGAEALQIKGVWSRSRKHHHPKLMPPVKSPRISSSKNASRASRLIDVATRILEPGLQATNRTKTALTYSNSMNYCPREEASTEEIRIMLPNIVKQQDVGDCKMGVSKSFTGKTSCKSCGNLFDVVASRPNVEEQQFVSPSDTSNGMSAQESEMIKPMPMVSSLKQESNATYQRNWDWQSFSVKEQDNTRVQNESITVIKPLSQDGQLQQQLRSQQCRPQQHETSATIKLRIPTQNEILVNKDRTPPRSKSNHLQGRRASSAANAISEATDFVALNRSIISGGRQRVFMAADNSTIEKARKVCSRRGDSLSPLRRPVHKKRTASVNAQIESTGFSNLMPMRQRIMKPDSGSNRTNGNRAKEVASGSGSMDHARTKNRSVNHGGHNRTNGNMANDVVSFTFHSPVRHKPFVSMGLKDRSHQIEKNSSSHQRKLVLDENYGGASLQKQLPLGGDVLGMILEQKLKELVSQEDELINGDTHPKRSTAMILQELIFALTSEKPVLNADETYQEERKTGRNSVGISHDGHHLSPGSVLEASFSNDSCFSSSLDDGSGSRLLSDCMDSSYNQLQPIDSDADLLGYATSLNQGKTGSKMLADLVNHISRILQSINLAGGGLTGNKLSHAKEVILNAELLFGNAVPCNSDRQQGFFIGPFLLDQLETVAHAMQTDFNSILGFEENKVGNQLRRFLFDCVIECLDSNASCYCNSGFKTWKRVALCLNAETLTQAICEEVRRWTDVAEMIPEDIIDWEMSHFLGKWTDFETERFEVGAEIDWDILQTLVEEIVIDLWECSVDSF